jgi:hypothetical protein
LGSSGWLSGSLDELVSETADDEELWPVPSVCSGSVSALTQYGVKMNARQQISASETANLVFALLFIIKTLSKKISLSRIVYNNIRIL